MRTLVLVLWSIWLVIVEVRAESSPITITPTPPIAGKPVTFSLSEASTAFTWIVFAGEEFVLNGNPVTATLSFFGPCTVKVRRAGALPADSDLARASFVLTGESYDMDVDGVPNELEGALGTNPTDKQSVSGTLQPQDDFFVTTSVRLKANGRKKDSDTLSLSAFYVRSSGRPNIAGSKVAVQLAGIVTVFDVTSKGTRLLASSATGNKNEKMRLRVFPNAIDFKIRLSKSNFTDKFIGHPIGIPDATLAESFAIPVILLIGGEIKADRTQVGLTVSSSGIISAKGGGNEKVPTR